MASKQAEKQLQEGGGREQMLQCLVSYVLDSVSHVLYGASVDDLKRSHQHLQKALASRTFGSEATKDSRVAASSSPCACAI